jgi:hypothetical protein
MLCGIRHEKGFSNLLDATLVEEPCRAICGNAGRRGEPSLLMRSLTRARSRQALAAHFEDRKLWRLFRDGATKGQIGSEKGTIVRDLEHSEGARITL